jgi:hypothetical protein
MATVLFTLTFSKPGVADWVQDGPYRNEGHDDPYRLEANGVNFTRDLPDHHDSPDSLHKFKMLLGSIFLTDGRRFHFSHDPVTDTVYMIADDWQGDPGLTIPLNPDGPPRPAPHPVPVPTGTYHGDFVAMGIDVLFTFTFSKPGKCDWVQDGPYRNEGHDDFYQLDANGVNFTRDSPESLPKFRVLLGSIFLTDGHRFHFSHDPVTDTSYIIADDWQGDPGCTILLRKKSESSGAVRPTQVNIPATGLGSKLLMAMNEPIVV